VHELDRSPLSPHWMVTRGMAMGRYPNGREVSSKSMIVLGHSWNKSRSLGMGWPLRKVEAREVRSNKRWLNVE